jgi:hypothetical protein
MAGQLPARRVEGILKASRDVKALDAMPIHRFVDLFAA